MANYGRGWDQGYGHQDRSAVPGPTSADRGAREAEARRLNDSLFALHEAHFGPPSTADVPADTDEGPSGP